MLIRSLFRKIRTFGLKGCVNQLIAFPKKLRLLRTITAYKTHSPPTPGITIIAPLSETSSLSKVMRDFIAALSKANIPYQTLDCNHPEIRTADFAVDRYTHIIGMLGTPHIPAMPGIQYSEVIFWEFEHGIAAAYPHLLDAGKSVIAMSDFNTQCFRAELPAQTLVHKINYPLVLTYSAATLPSPSETRRRFHIPESYFAVFFNVFIGSNRKNPDGCIRAFAEAFAEFPDTVLVFKIMYADRSPDIYNNLIQLSKDLKIYDRFVTITEYVSEKDIYALTNSCDCYLSLHRGEGFGLGIAEAMSLGKPVVVTDYSSTTEFCNSQNSLLVPYKLIKPNLSEFDKTVYHHVDAWADPDIHVAARSLRRLYEDEYLRSRIGTAAAESIATQFSTAAFKASAERFLCQ